MKKIAIIIAPALALGLGGCTMNGTANSLGMECKTMTTIAGAGLGVLAGSFFGAGSGNALSMALGGVAGGVAGNQMSGLLGCEEQKAIAQAAPQAASAPTGSSISWASPTSGTGGDIKLIGGFAAAADKPGQFCRPIIVTMTTKTGQTVSQPDTLCEPASNMVTTESEAMAKPYTAPVQRPSQGI